MSPLGFVAVLVRLNGCRRYGLSPFPSVAVSVCLKWMSPLWFVAVSVCRRSGLSPFQSVAVLTVAVSVCHRFDCRRFGSSKMDVAVMVCRCFCFSPFRFVVVSVCRRFDSPPIFSFKFKFCYFL